MVQALGISEKKQKHYIKVTNHITQQSDQLANSTAVQADVLWVSLMMFGAANLFTDEECLSGRAESRKLGTIQAS